MMGASRYAGKHMGRYIFFIEQPLRTRRGYSKNPAFIFLQYFFYKTPLQQAKLNPVKIITRIKSGLLYNTNVSMHDITKTTAYRILCKQNNTAEQHAGYSHYGNRPP